MSDPNIPPKAIFPSSKVDAVSARHVPSSPQTESDAYKLAFLDAVVLLLREKGREDGVRLVVKREEAEGRVRVRLRRRGDDE